MKNNLKFFVIKLLILVIIEAVLMLVCFAIKWVFDKIGMTGLLGANNADVVVSAIGFIAFLIYTLWKTSGFKKEENSGGLGIFVLKEGIIYAAFILPLLIIMLCTGNIPAAVDFFYKPQTVLFKCLGSAAGYGVSVILYCLIALSARLISGKRINTASED